MSKRPAPSSSASSLPLHPIQIVTRRTGLSADVVRAWEKRHGVVAPVRSPSGRRLYSDDDVERLRLLAQATLTGRTIGQVAALPTAAIAALVDAGTPAARRDVDGARAEPAAPSPAAHLLDDALAAIARFDGVALDLLLRRATVALSAADFLDALVLPLIERIGALRGSQRHVAQTVLRRVLDHTVATATAPLASPDLVVATPSAHAPELGALTVAAAAADEGWRVTYIGPGVPAEDLAETVRHLQARIVAVSLGAAPADRALPRELRRLRTLLPRGVEILVEGAAVNVHRAVLGEIGAVVLHDLAALRGHLRAQRTR